MLAPLQLKIVGKQTSSPHLARGTPGKSTWFTGGQAESLGHDVDALTVCLELSNVHAGPPQAAAVISVPTTSAVSGVPAVSKVPVAHDTALLAVGSAPAAHSSSQQQVVSTARAAAL